MSGRFEIKVADDKSSVSVKTIDDSGTEVAATLDSGKLLSLIKALGAAHSKLIDGRPVERLEGQKIEAVLNAQWFVNPQLMGEASALSFYHPAFGPVGFLVPIDQVDYMTSLLAKQVELAKSSRRGKGN